MRGQFKYLLCALDLSADLREQPMPTEYEEIGITYTVSSSGATTPNLNAPYFPDNSLYYSGYGWWPQGLQFHSPSPFTYVQTSPTTFDYYIFSTSVLNVTTDPTQYQNWLSTYVSAPAVPPAIAFNGTNYVGTPLEIGYQPIFWEQIYVAPPAALFTTGADAVNFNNLQPSQQAAIAAGPSTILYNGLGGSDSVTLPSVASYNVSLSSAGGTLGWDSSQTFQTGSLAGDSYHVTGSDGSYKIALGAGSDTITITGNGNSTIYAGTGSDAITINGSGANTINIGTGTATITLSGSNNNISFNGHAGTANLFLQQNFKENINGFTSGDFIDLLNVGNVTLSSALNSAGVFNPGEVDLYANGSKIGALFFDSSVDYTQLKPVSDGTGGTEIVLDSTSGPQDPSGTQINWTFVHKWESRGEGVVGETELAPYISTGASGLTLAQGVDIGDAGNAVSFIGTLLNTWQSDPNIALISTFINKTHAQAIAALPPSAPLRGNPASEAVSLTTTQANAITNYTEQYIYDHLSADYTNDPGNTAHVAFTSLSANRQTAIFDFAYNIALHRTGTHKGIEDLTYSSNNMWNLLVTQQWTTAAQLMAHEFGDASRRGQDAQMLLDGLSASLPVAQTDQLIANNSHYDFSTDTVTQFAVDPTGPFLTLTENMGSPKISSLELPLTEANSYSVSYETGTVWSTSQVAHPGDTINFGGTGVNGLQIVMLDANGLPLTGSPDFTFYLTFASAGTFSATVTSADQPPNASTTAHVTGHDLFGHGAGDYFIFSDTPSSSDPSSGTLNMFDLGPTGSLTQIGQVGSDWAVAGSGDFNGDGRSDLLMQHDTGNIRDLYDFTMGPNSVTAITKFGTVGTDWQVDGTGDFNGDGTKDVLLERLANGTKELDILGVKTAPFNQLQKREFCPQTSSWTGSATSKTTAMQTS
jgi:hypothetical protein